MTKIQRVHGREVLDSRGNPTVEAEILLSNGVEGRAIVPSGASTGTYEVVERRDRESGRFGGKGVLGAVSAVDGEIASALKGMSPFDQGAVDRVMIDLDGTSNKSRLGANAILAVSLAVAHASARAESIPLYRYLAIDSENYTIPVPMFNILNGGQHARDSTDFQEFMVVPVGSPTFPEALRAGAEIYRSLGQLLGELRLSTNVGDEGGFAPSLDSNEDALKLVLDAILKAGYRPGGDCFVALDIAASELLQADKYHLSKEGLDKTSGEMVAYYDDWVERYPILSIEDGLAEDDWEGWRALCARLGSKVQLVGDDLYVTNMRRIRQGIEIHASNAVLIKLNQIGTITETLEAVTTAREAGWGIVLSHRSGETEDTTIADLAVAWSIGQIKAGAPCRTERVAKYNRLLRITEELGDKARYAGESAYRHVRLPA
jgi:enolase